MCIGLRDRGLHPRDDPGDGQEIAVGATEGGGQGVDADIDEEFCPEAVHDVVGNGGEQAAAAEYLRRLLQQHDAAVIGSGQKAEVGRPAAGVADMATGKEGGAFGGCAEGDGGRAGHETAVEMGDAVLHEEQQGALSAAGAGRR